MAGRPRTSRSPRLRLCRPIARAPIWVVKAYSIKCKFSFFLLPLSQPYSRSTAVVVGELHIVVFDACVGAPKVDTFAGVLLGLIAPVSRVNYARFTRQRGVIPSTVRHHQNYTSISKISITILAKNTVVSACSIVICK